MTKKHEKQASYAIAVLPNANFHVKQDKVFVGLIAKAREKIAALRAEKKKSNRS